MYKGESYRTYTDVSAVDCQKYCLAEPDGTCLSVEYVSSNRTCYVTGEHTSNLLGTDSVEGVDVYERYLDCHEPASFTHGCNAGWDYSDRTGSCYYISQERYKANDWWMSEERCKKRGGRLVSIDSSEEIQALHRMWKYQGGAGLGHVFWIGGVKENNSWR